MVGRRICLDLYHFYDKSIGPFKSLTTLSQEEAWKVLENIKRTKPA